MSEPLVSIIIPVYNAEKYLAQAVASVMSQTYKNWELIIVNDGSTDSSLNVAKSFECENIKVLTQSNNGASAARNYGLKEANGAYIQFLDADDVLSKNKIGEQVHLLYQNPGKVAYCPTVHFFDGEDYLNKEVTHDWFHTHDESPVEFLVILYGGYPNLGGMIQPNAWLTPIEIIQKAGLWNEELSLDDDGEYFCRVVLNCKGVLYSERAINYYRKFKCSNNLSAQQSRKAMESLLKSTELKRDYLLAKTNSVNAKVGLARLFREFQVISFPHFPDLSGRAYEHIKTLGGTDYVPTIGGPRIERIKNLMGWKFAKKLQFHLSKLKN